MRFIFCVVVLSSLMVFHMANCDIVDENNATINNDQSLNKLSKETEETNIHNTNTDILLQSKEQDTNNKLIDAVDHTQLNSSIPNPVIPTMSDNSSHILQIESSDSVIRDDKSPLDNDTAKAQVIDVTNKDDAQTTNTDDIPTFVEYQQMLEKESKQKREKSDSIPNIPTTILKDNHPIKGAIDVASSHVTGEHSETSKQSSSNGQDIKDDSEAGQTARKSDESKVEITTSILSKSLMKNNVAAKECGAKILEISGQITNAGFVLNNNKDEYLNVPCSITEKWFIFETCEPVQIRSIQIANFEMFSSRPKTFKVMSADRYPVKHWYNLGLFRALDEKGIQTFEVSDTRMVKYLKFEMIDHYGSEHYCPLTFVRVMGNVVIDDMDEESDDDQPAIGGQLESPKETPSTAANSNGILTKAKDMIVKIVNGIGGSQKEDDLKKNDIEGEISERNGTKHEDLASSESPCYFVEFLSKNYRNYLQEIWLGFQRLSSLKNHLVEDVDLTLESKIRHQPFPSQIRVEYFTLLDLITKTDYSFWRLYLSFSNASSHLPNICFVQNSLRNLSTAFKCSIYNYPSSGNYQPILPNISTSPMIQEPSIDNTAPTVLIPDTAIKGVDGINDVSEVSTGQYEPALSGNMDTTSTSNHPTTINDSLVDPMQVTNKNKTDEDLPSISKDNRTNQAAKEIKSESNESIGTESQKTTQTKYKSDDVFDSKIFASPGSNAWNYAFMRIKNIAKELEVNVSISMKYLEELSQNYKQQTDKLKKAQLVMATNVSKLENMINKHREETKKYIKELKVQLQTIIFRKKIVVSSDVSKKRTSSSLNLSTMEKDSDSECIDLLSDGLIIPSPSWFDSSLFLIVMNVSLSLFCNSILLAIFYHKMKANILNDVTKIMAASNNNDRYSSIYEPIEEIPVVCHQRRSSLIDLRPQRTTFPLVLPPRGVSVTNFPDSDYLSDNDNLPRLHKGIGPFFNPVQPNVNFVTPSKWVHFTD